MPGFIEIENVSFSYPIRDSPDIKAIKSFNLSIAQGEFAAVIGPNGSGKSTLGKLLNALLLPDDGVVLIDGMNTKDPQFLPKIRSMVGMIFQRPQDQIVATTVAEDTAFGPSNLGLPAAEIRKRVEYALNATGLKDFGDRPSYLLSAGETQRLALAGVLAMRPRCVIFDETTAMLDPAGREMVMRQAKSLQEQGITILFITHLMDEAVQADRVLVLHEGQLVMDGSPEIIFSESNQLKTYGMELPEVTQLANDLNSFIPEIPRGILFEKDFFKAIPKITVRNHIADEKGNDYKNAAEVIAVEHLSHIYLCDTVLAHQSLKDVNFSTKQGSVKGLIGSTGSGKSTLLQHLNALIRPQSGKVIVLGEDLGQENLDVKELRKRVGLVFQQPENQLFEQYVGDEVAFAAKNFGIQGRLADIVREAMTAAGLNFDDFKDRFTSSLSGGEQRKVALASVLAGQPEILLLDEPLAGLDPKSRQAITQYLQSLSEKGMTLVLSTHQFDDVAEMLDGISVLSGGRDIMSGEAWKIFTRFDDLEAAGIKPSLGVQAVEAFRQRGWPIPENTVSINQLVHQVKILIQEKLDE